MVPLSLAVVDLGPVLACLVACGVMGWFVPTLIARVPEPEPEPEPAPEPAAETADEQPGERAAFARTLPPPPPKELYVDIAARPHLAQWSVLWSAVVGASFGAALGWTGALVFLVPLVPIGVALFVLDWRTTLLPTRILHPTYVLMAVLVPLAALVDQDLDSLYRAGWGWLVVGGWFWVFWWLFTAWGFGDVRLSRVLGPALGFLGWSQMLVGLALMVFIGALGGVATGAMRRSLRQRFAYGPFMLVGAAISVVAGPWIARSLGY